jgi:hypothetical protein
MVALDGLNFAELEPLDCMPVIFGFEYIGVPEREFMGSVVTREAERRFMLDCNVIRCG